VDLPLLADGASDRRHLLCPAQSPDARRRRAERRQAGSAWRCSPPSRWSARYDLTTLGHDLLPPLYRQVGVSNYPNLIRASAAVIALAIVAMVMLFRQRKSALDSGCWS
jgi:hypothetical protein